MPETMSLFKTKKSFCTQLFRKDKRSALIFFLLVITFFSSGCYGINYLSDMGAEQVSASRFVLPDPLQDPPQAGDARLGYLYYMDDRNRFLVPVRREIPWVENIAASTLQLLILSEDSAEPLRELGLSPTLPSQTKIIGMAINDGLARVNFSAEFLSYPPDHERLVLCSVLCTLQQFTTIETVEILVDGEKVSQFPGGAPGRMFLGPESYINLELEPEADYRNFTAITLFFCYLAPNGRILYVPVTRALSPVENIYQAVIQELLEGPRQGSGLFSDLPPGTELRSFDLLEGQAVLDFSEQLLHYQGGRTGAENMINQILLTLSALEEIDQVQILAEGQKVSLDGFDLTAPLVLPEVYNYF